MATKVGYIGLGSMGTPKARNTLAAGFDLKVYDLRPEPLQELRGLGAGIARNITEIAEWADIIGIIVRNDQQVEQVVLGDNGVLAAARRDSVIVIHSTVHPQTVRKLGEIVVKRGVGLIDAQMTNGYTGCIRKALTYLVGGDKALLERCRPIFSASATNIFHMGPLGSGAAMKLVQQSILCLNMLGAYEGLRLAEAAGLDLTHVVEALKTTPAASHVIEHWQERFRNLWQTPGYLETLIPAQALARDLGVRVPGIAMAHQLFPLLATLPEKKEPGGH